MFQNRFQISTILALPFIVTGGLSLITSIFLFFLEGYVSMVVLLLLFIYIVTFIIGIGVYARKSWARDALLFSGGLFLFLTILALWASLLEFLEDPNLALEERGIGIFFNLGILITLILFYILLLTNKSIIETLPQRDFDIDILDANTNEDVELS